MQWIIFKSYGKLAQSKVNQDDKRSSRINSKKTIKEVEKQSFEILDKDMKEITLIKYVPKQEVLLWEDLWWKILRNTKWWGWERLH